jgi:hypothetical protein
MIGFEEIGNYYGGLNCKEENGKFYWSIENYDGHDWSEITEELYRALEKFSEIEENYG